MRDSGMEDVVYFAESRRAYSEMLEDGWIDARSRHIHPEKGIDTYWNFSLPRRIRPDLRPQDGPLSLSPSLVKSLCNSGVDIEARSWEKPSDHAPAWVELEGLGDLKRLLPEAGDLARRNARSPFLQSPSEVLNAEAAALCPAITE